MASFNEQMDHIHHEKEYTLILPNDDWTLRDYKELFYYIKKGYLMQYEDWDTSINGFVVNPDWDWGGGDEIYEDI